MDSDGICKYLALIYLRSSTEGAGGLLYCWRYAKVHKYSRCGTAQKEKPNKEWDKTQK